MTTTHQSAPLSDFTIEEERAQLQMLTDFALDAVIIMEESGRIIEWNPRAEEMFGWGRNEAIGAMVNELIVLPRFLESHHRWFERFSNSPPGEMMNERHKLLGMRSDGSEIPVEVTMWTLHPSGGRGRKLCSAFIRDLSPIEDAAKMQARLAAIVDSSDDAIIGKDLDGTILAWNRGAERLYGYTAAEAIDSHISLIIPPDKPDELREITDRLQRGEHIEHFDTTRLTKTGQRIDVSLTVSPIFGRHGEPIGASSIARDVTDRKRLESESRKLNEELERRVDQRTAELAEANRRLEGLVESKTDFVASVSHELRTPLTSVIGFAELLMDSSTEFDREQRLDLLAAIADQGYELANIVEDLLVAARSEIGDLNVSKVSVNLKAQTAQVMESMRNDEARAVALSGEAQFVIADPQRVRQILRNLVTNAIRYGGPNIAVSVGEPVDGLASVIVSDDGNGIPDSAREKVFDPYTRAHSRGEGTTESFGLGLAISRDLARLMGGDLRYRRTDRTEFILELPVDLSRYT